MSDLLEILSPVGDMERLYAALDFGAMLSISAARASE